MTRKKKGGFAWFGRGGKRKGGGVGCLGGSARASPKRGGRGRSKTPPECKRCKSHSAPSTPRGSRSPSPPGSPRGGRRARGPTGYCFGGGGSKGAAGGSKSPSSGSRTPRSRSQSPDGSPRALPIELFPDTVPRHVKVQHVCQSPRRGCSDHRCHKEKPRRWCTIS